MIWVGYLFWVSGYLVGFGVLGPKLGLYSILRYLQATIDHGVYFIAVSRLSLVGYLDASWGNGPDDRRSMFGFCIFLGGSPISWGSKK